MTTGRWRGLPLRSRLTIWYAAALLAVLLVYAVLVFAFLKHSLWQQLDARLHEAAENEEAVLQPIWTGTGPPHAAADRDDTDDDDPWVEVWDRAGRRLYQSSRAARLPLPDVEAPSGTRVRSVVAAGRHVRVRDEAGRIAGQPVYLRTAESEERLREALAALLLLMGMGLPLAVGAAAVGGYRLARRALAPVDRIAERVEAITAERLGDRLPVENPNDEIGRLATVVNGTLARLEQSFEQMRRFTADASHELRTPLTAIRTVGEVSLREPHDEAAYREVVGSMLEEVDRLTRLVDTMLLLSRAEAGYIPVNRQPTDLAALATEVAAQLEVLAEEKRQRLAVHADGPAWAIVDPVVLRLALVNLVDNAIRHSPAACRIDVRVSSEPAGAVIEVEDHGRGIPAADRTRLFDRFYRVDVARSRSEGGAGLGLAIARWAVEVQDGSIQLASEEGRGSTFRITVPRADLTPAVPA
ncbi:MAG: sensor histidine kinase [Betaproteobacteria bacterium]